MRERKGSLFFEGGGGGVVDGQVNQQRHCDHWKLTPITVKLHGQSGVLIGRGQGALLQGELEHEVRTLRNGIGNRSGNPGHGTNL